MNYRIKKLIIWFKNGTTRELTFQPNKVNIITGTSNTGKTAIIDIIDYCFFASESKISQDIINDNASWYGLVLSHNESEFTFARKSPYFSKFSNEFYFIELDSSHITPYQNSNEDTLKKYFNSIFNITENTKVEYGGKYHSKNSKISIRYFQMFNTISGNIIENDSGVFFDKQNKERYREALPRIFDLSVGIETVENIIKRETVDALENKIKRLERKNSRLNNQSQDFIEEQSKLIAISKEYSLIDPNLDSKEAWSQILNLDINSILSESNDGERDKIEKEYFSTIKKIRNLKRFSSQYSQYKDSLKNIESNIKPIEYLKSIDCELIKTSIYSDIVSNLSDQVAKIKIERRGKTPLSIQVEDQILKLENKAESYRAQLEDYKKNHAYEYNSSKEKFYYLGEITTKAKFYKHKPQAENLFDISEIQRQIEDISIEDTTERKRLTCEAIEDIISDYMSIVGESLVNYSNYKPSFNYKDKNLSLRKPRSAYIENVGSSSNHMFLQLFFSLSLHEIIMTNNAQFVAPYLIIDQPSRPYYGDENESEKKLTSSDQSKIKSAFKLLDCFVGNAINNGNDFQMIVLEHTPKELTLEFENTHIVEEFRNGNALVNKENITSASD
ncbi:AAA_23 domain-containing protein [Vibrio chagasii]|nr:AAA_23 domain-containing protein [Vibrio chagasii]CAH7300092.1 AAA_23 domain-containing protein [Vibrio chagasii]